MLSYVFLNGKKRKEDIVKLCMEQFALETIRSNDESIFMVNKLITILIKKEYTHIILKNENVNIQKIEAFF